MKAKTESWPNFDQTFFASLHDIALWLGHERPITTHGYVAVDLKMKEESLQRLEALPAARRPRRDPSSRLLAFLEAL